MRRTWPDGEIDERCFSAYDVATLPRKIHLCLGKTFSASIRTRAAKIHALSAIISRQMQRGLRSVRPQLFL